MAIENDALFAPVATHVALAACMYVLYMGTTAAAEWRRTHGETL
jgi:hypothetical protein